METTTEPTPQATTTEPQENGTSPAPEQPQEAQEAPANDGKKTVKKGRKKRKRKEGDNEETQNDQKKGKRTAKKGGRKRERKFQWDEPKNWRKDVEETTTLETEMPPKVDKKDLPKKPEWKDTLKLLEKKNKEVTKKRKKIDELYKEKDAAREKAWEKQNVGQKEFRELKKNLDDAKTAVEEKRAELKMEAKKKKKGKKQDALRRLNDRNPFRGVAKSGAKAEEHIRNLEERFRDVRKTAKEEKAMMDEIKKLKAWLPNFQRVDELRAEVDKLKTEINKGWDVIKPLQKKRDAAWDKFKKNRDEYRLKKEAEEAEKGESKPKEEEGKKGKKERVMSPEERAVLDKIEKVRDEIKLIYKAKDELVDAHDKKMMEFRKAHYEWVRGRYVAKVLKDLKYKAKQQKWEDEKEQRAAEEEKRKKEARKRIFETEIETVAAVASTLQLLKLDRDRPTTGLLSNGNVGAQETQFAEGELESENLELVARKKPRDEIVPLSKKKRKNRKKKRGQKIMTVELVGDKRPKNMLIPADTSASLTEMGIEIPTNLDQIEETLVEVGKKTQFYLNLREKFVEQQEMTEEEKKIVARGEANMEQKLYREETERRDKEEREGRGRGRGGRGRGRRGRDEDGEGRGGRDRDREDRGERRTRRGGRGMRGRRREDREPREERKPRQPEQEVQNQEPAQKAPAPKRKPQKKLAEEDFPTL